MPKVHIVRVFVNEQGQFGDLASTIFDTDQTLDNATRQILTRQIGHPETVFVNNLANAQVSIFNPQQEVKIAGAPLVGTAWLLGNMSTVQVSTIHCQGGNVRT